MSRIALVVAIDCEPEHQQAVLRALLAHRERCLAQEPGTLQFEVLIPLDEPIKIRLFELYADSVALAAHSQGASIARFRQEVDGKIIRVVSHKCAADNALTA